MYHICLFLSLFYRFVGKFRQCGMFLFFIYNSLCNVYFIYDSCILLLDATKNSNRNSDHISLASEYQSNLSNLPQNREYDQQNDPDRLSKGQTRHSYRFTQQQSNNSDPLVKVILFSIIFHYGDWFWFSPYFYDIHIILYIQHTCTNDILCNTSCFEVRF
jgi:hypothetical protein